MDLRFDGCRILGGFILFFPILFGIWDKYDILVMCIYIYKMRAILWDASLEALIS